ncbi:hypothetical protein FSARC_11581 [Fusarium sarcochroum]|uniref:Uncharacterized protein n=1 Tax=Fusarium sarcochroum TaxID=1208366 RepID=A0A8H4TEG1_9HYPO|nr:hypothetical protein FSARC_11581 [Fusarium sarcochroum]
MHSVDPRICCDSRARDAGRTTGSISIISSCREPGPRSSVAGKGKLLDDAIGLLRTAMTEFVVQQANPLPGASSKPDQVHGEVEKWCH